MGSRQLNPSNPIRVGVIGAGEVSQVIHLPTLLLLSDLYKVVALCDVSQSALKHVATKFSIPRTYTSSIELVGQDDVDLVIVASADEYHCQHAVEAIEAGKHVLIEKPMTLTRKDAQKIEQARRKYKVAVYVAYMRRYTPVFATFLEELRKAGPISFARVFDYSGPNSIFVSQSATFPKVFGDDVPGDAREEKSQRGIEAATEALGAQKARDPRLVKVYRLLASLASHDLSCMRHAFGGVPTRCTTAFAAQDGNFVGATFEYDRQPKGQACEEQGTPFQVSFEAGIHSIGTFPAAIEVFCKNAIVSIVYDTPYVKGLPIKVVIKENVGTDGKGYQEREIRPTFLDAYTAEFLRLNKALRGSNEWQSVEDEGETLDSATWGQSAEMCTASDAVKDLEVFDMIMAHLK